MSTAGPLVKPKVCLFTDSLAPSGVGEHMFTLAAEFVDRFAVSFVCPPTPSGLKLLDRVSDLGAATLPLEVRGETSAGDELALWLKRERFDLFHAHAGVSWEGHTGIRAAHSAGVGRVVRTEHLAELTVVFRSEQLHDLIYSPYHQPEGRLGPEELARLVDLQHREYLDVVELADRVICVSAGVRETFIRVGVPQDKLQVVRNGIQPRTSSASSAAVKERLELDPETRIVLTIGRLIDVKGYPYLLEAVPAVVKQVPEARFLWVGEGPLENELRERVQSLGLDDRVCFAGPRSDVPDLFVTADLFVMPSLVEGLPLGALEAMAAGLPIVGTRVCGTSEVIRDGVTGRLVPPGDLVETRDAADLAAAILEPLEDPLVAKRWGANGRSLFQQEFTARRMARETADVYDAVLALIR